MAAQAGLLESLSPGARVLVPDACYTGLRLLGDEFLPERGVACRKVDMSDLDAVRNAAATGVDLLWVETPSNPRMQISDIAALAGIARAHGWCATTLSPRHY